MTILEAARIEECTNQTFNTELKDISFSQEQILWKICAKTAIAMAPLLLVTNVGYRPSGSFFSERAKPIRLSLMPMKSSALRHHGSYSLGGCLNETGAGRPNAQIAHDLTPRKNPL
jgi:hypothetical protein